MATKAWRELARTGAGRVASRRAKLLVAVPAVMTLGLAMRHEPTVDSFAFANAADFDRRIDAYLPVLRLTEPHVDPTGVMMDAAAAERLSKDWISASEAGKLEPLRPASRGGSIFDGATGQILRAEGAVANALIVHGERQIRRGALRAGAEDVIRGIKVYRPTYYSDFETISLHSLQIRRAIGILQRAKARMSPNDRSWLGTAIRPLGSDPGRMAETALAMRHQFEASPSNAGSGFDPRSVGTKVPDVETQITELEAKPEYRPFVRALQRALASDAATQHRIDKLLAP